MAVCSSCGFESAPDSGPCPLCGAAPSGTTATIPMAPQGIFTMDGRGRRGPELGAGEVYAGRFHVLGVLGRGGMGTVYRVRELEGPRELALKVLLPAASEELRGAERFRREVELLGKVRHPAVPRVLTWGSTGEEMYLVTELIEGGTLKDEVVRRGALGIAESVEVATTVAEALGAAHTAGVIHRDIKPQNIMIARPTSETGPIPAGAIRLLDFGIARSVGLDMKTITATDMVVGTPDYMAPEQFTSHRVDERCDQYALGIVMYEMLTGRLPFRGDTPIAVALQHKSDPPQPPRSLRPEIPAWLERTVLRCLEKDRTKRFPSVLDLAAELRRPRTSARTPLRRLPNGDFAMEDSSEASAWALVLASPREKDGWQTGMTLLFEGRYYRLDELVPAEGKGDRWAYRFSACDEGQVFRRLVDYEADDRDRVEREQKALSSKLKGWFSGGPKA